MRLLLGLLTRRCVIRADSDGRGTPRGRFRTRAARPMGARGGILAEQDDNDRRYESLADAFRDRRTSVANQRFLQRLLGGIDVEGFDRYADHFRVIRSSGDPWLEVHYGSTNGFRSPEEITAAVPSAVVSPSKARPGTWRVEHPDRAPDGSAGGLDGRLRRFEGGRCSECGDVLSVSGVCNNPTCSGFGITQ